MKIDIADLKTSQQQFENLKLIHKVLDGIARIERVLVNIENDLRPKVNVSQLDSFRAGPFFGWHPDPAGLTRVPKPENAIAIYR